MDNSWQIYALLFIVMAFSYELIDILHYCDSIHDCEYSHCLYYTNSISFTITVHVHMNEPLQL